MFGFYANKQMTTGEGGIVTMADAALKERIDSERNQGRAPDMGWLDHDRLGFNYRLSDIACALGLAQLERLDEMLGARARVADAYRDALAGIEGLQLPCPDADGNRRGWFVFVVQLPRDVDRDGCVRALAELGIPSKPYFPAVHLMTYYREQFGHREGEFPVCEDVAARSIALPFFPQMTEGQVERVGEALRRVLQPAQPADLDVALLRASASRLPGPERLDRVRPPAGAVRRGAVAGARGDARVARDHLRRRTRRAASAGSTRCSESSTAGRSRSPTATRTSTWRSSGG